MANAITADLLEHSKLELVTPLQAADGTTQLKIVDAYEPHLELEGSAQLSKLLVKDRGRTEGATLQPFQG